MPWRSPSSLRSEEGYAADSLAGRRLQPIHAEMRDRQRSVSNLQRSLTPGLVAGCSRPRLCENPAVAKFQGSSDPSRGHDRRF